MGALWPGMLLLAHLLLESVLEQEQLLPVALLLVLLQVLLQRRLAQLQQVQLALDHGDLQVAALELQLPQGLLLVLALVVAGLPL